MNTSPELTLSQPWVEQEPLSISRYHDGVVPLCLTSWQSRSGVRESPSTLSVVSELFFSTMSRLKCKKSLTNENDSNFPAWLKVNNKVRLVVLAVSSYHCLEIIFLFLYKPSPSLDDWRPARTDWTLLYNLACYRQYYYLSNKWLDQHHIKSSQFILSAVFSFVKRVGVEG